MRKLIFERDMTLLIKYTVDLELIRQKNQTQINKDNIRDKIVKEQTITIKLETKSCSIIILI